MRALIIGVAAILLISGIATAGFFFYSLWGDYTPLADGPILLNESSQVGGFVGGVVGTIFSIAGFFLLILTLSEQRKYADKERFESKFFDLVKLHRENVSEMTSQDASGRKQLHNIYQQFLTCREEMKPLFKRSYLPYIYEDAYLADLQKQLSYTNPKIDYLDLAKYNYAYLVVFYGVGVEGKRAILELLAGRYKTEFTEKVIQYAAMKPIIESKFYPTWETVMKSTGFRKKIRTFELIRKLRNKEHIEGLDEAEILQKATDNQYPSRYIKYYGGHQYQLGHYYRHMFQTFTFINIQKTLSEREKYFYAKTFRAQLSTSEQALLFLNSISSLGLRWDLIPKVRKYRFDFSYEKRLHNARLITKFNLIKNLPGNRIFEINLADYYPEVDYEHVPRIDSAI